MMYLSFKIGFFTIFTVKKEIFHVLIAIRWFGQNILVRFFLFIKVG